MNVGVFGAGQLGRMLALSGYPLGIHCSFLDPVPDSPASKVGPHFCADYHDASALRAFTKALQVVTYEFENVPLDIIQPLQKTLPVYPPAQALAVMQERLLEKTFLQQLGIATPAFHKVDSPEELVQAAELLGLPLVLKSRRFGYDGKGQAVVRTEADLAAAVSQARADSLLAERFIPFEREWSLLGVRAESGECRFYPLVQNYHRAGILRFSLAPLLPERSLLQQRAETVARQILTATNYVGLLTIEFFEQQGDLLVNELAPRVHNSGHWTIEGASCSQFENHLRAITGLPLGSTAVKGPALLLNLLGELPEVSRLLALPGVHVHLYDKAPKPGRKIGHVTLTQASWPELRTVAEQAMPLCLSEADQAEVLNRLATRERLAEPVS